MLRWVTAHFERYSQRKPWDFCWRITLEGTAVCLAAVIVLHFLSLGERNLNEDLGFLVLAGVFLAPILETLLLQGLPVWIAQHCKARFSVQIVASVVPFTFVHALEGAGAAIAVGLIAGFYFAFTYVHWSQQSRWTAFWVTTVSHAGHNAILILLAYLLGDL